MVEQVGRCRDRVRGSAVLLKLSELESTSSRRNVLIVSLSDTAQLDEVIDRAVDRRARAAEGGDELGLASRFICKRFENGIPLFENTPNLVIAVWHMG